MGISEQTRLLTVTWPTEVTSHHDISTFYHTSSCFLLLPIAPSSHMIFWIICAFPDSEDLMWAACRHTCIPITRQNVFCSLCPIWFFRYFLFTNSPFRKVPYSLYLCRVFTHSDLPPGVIGTIKCNHTDKTVSPDQGYTAGTGLVSDIPSHSPA